MLNDNTKKFNEPDQIGERKYSTEGLNAVLAEKERAIKERNLLGEAILKAARSQGITDRTGATGPELLHLAECLSRPTRTIRIYLGELDDEFVEVQVTQEAFDKMRNAEKINVDDGGIWFAELIWKYTQK